MDPLTWCEIDADALAYNYAQLLKMASAHMLSISRPAIMPVIKADAYGHGMLDVAKILDENNCHFFGVSNAEEGVLLREKGFKQQILLFESTMPKDAKTIVANDLTATVCSQAMAEALHQEAVLMGKTALAHLKVDTGMGRLGLDEREVLPLAEFIRRDCLACVLEGVYTHFPLADTDKDFTFEQMRRFRDIVYSLNNRMFEFKYVHAGNSMGLGDYKSELFNLARPGIMLYGLYPSPLLKDKIRLKPVMSVKTRVIFLRDIAPGQGISYGHTFKAPRQMSIAVLPIGYSNGYMRAMSNRASVLIDGHRCPVVGRITMDQTMVDVTKVKSHVSTASEVVVLGHQKRASICADDLADWAGTISYEILCSLGSRLPKKILSTPIPLFEKTES